MNPFQKLKLTIDRVGLEYISPEDEAGFKKTSVYQAAQPQQNNQDNQDAPYFRNTQPINQNTNNNRYRSVIHEQEMEELKIMYENQQKNYILEINSLTEKLKSAEDNNKKLEKSNYAQKNQIQSLERQNLQLKAYASDVEEKSSKKMSESGMFEKQRKYREQIDRVNSTLSQIANDLNSERNIKKALQKEVQNLKLTLQQNQQDKIQSIHERQKQIQNLKEQLEKRSQLLQHSIKSARDQKILMKKQIVQLNQKHDNKIDVVRSQLDKYKDECFKLKNQINWFENNQSRLQEIKSKGQSEIKELRQKYQEKESSLIKYKEKLQQTQHQVNQSKVEVSYLKQQLNGQRKNTKVKVVQVRDQTLQMELSMYKNQCRQLLKDKSIWQGMDKDKSDYTIVQTSQILK